MFPKVIKKRYVFLDIANHGNSAKAKGIVAVCLKMSIPDSLVGYTASKRVGNAVKRNFAKRRMRALVREFSDFFMRGDTFVFIANRNTVDMKFSDLKNDFRKVIVKARDGR